MKLFKIIFSLCWVLIVAACATSKTIQLYYPGPALPLADVGVVSYDPALKVKIQDPAGHDVRPLQTYGASGAHSTFAQHHFLPGIYTFKFEFYKNNCLTINVKGDCLSWSKTKSAFNTARIIRINKGDIIHFSIVRDGHGWSVDQLDDSAHRNDIESSDATLINSHHK
jgi:hypothetical protein